MVVLFFVRWNERILRQAQPNWELACGLVRGLDNVSLTTTQYKGVAILTALLAAGTTLWFSRSDVHIKAVDAAEDGAGCADCSGEYLSGIPSAYYGSGIPVPAWFSTAWEINGAVTNAWGGYQSFDITKPDGSIPPPYLDGYGNAVFPFYGHYAFSVRRYHGNAGDLDLYGNPVIYDADCTDVYTNLARIVDIYGYTNGAALWDFGPGGKPQNQQSYRI